MVRICIQEVSWPPVCQCIHPKSCSVSHYNKIIKIKISSLDTNRLMSATISVPLVKVFLPEGQPCRGSLLWHWGSPLHDLARGTTSEGCSMSKGSNTFLKQGGKKSSPLTLSIGYNAFVVPWGTLKPDYLYGVFFVLGTISLFCFQRAYTLWPERYAWLVSETSKLKKWQILGWGQKIHIGIHRKLQCLNIWQHRWCALSASVQEVWNYWHHKTLCESFSY